MKLAQGFHLAATNEAFHSVIVAHMPDATNSLFNDLKVMVESVPKRLCPRISRYNAKEIYLVGFDFNGTIGRYSFSKNKNKNQKLKKLKWCKYLIELLKINKKNIYHL